jgi:hypothetical protein
MQQNGRQRTKWSTANKMEDSSFWQLLKDSSSDQLTQIDAKYVNFLHIAGSPKICACVLGSL